MPELPEVEVVRRGLAPHVRGRRIVAAEVRGERVARRHPGGPAALRDALLGAELGEPRRRGKFLWIPLASGVGAGGAGGAAGAVPGAPRRALAVHLGMSGQMLVDPPGAARAAAGPHVRAAVDLDDGTRVRFLDQRTFGWWAVEPLTATDDGVDTVPEAAAHIARDPLDSALDRVAVVARMRGSARAIKAILLDQEVVSGIGNIYADEALWRARVHPRRPGAAVTARTAGRVLDAAAETMTAALAVGGTSFDALYVDVDGASGYFARELQAYGRTGEPCRRCATPLRRIVVGGRSTHYCPRCQRNR